MKLILKQVTTGERAFRTTNIHGRINPSTRVNVYDESGKKIALAAQEKDARGAWLVECGECDSGPFVGTLDDALAQHFATNKEPVVEVSRA